ncbi:MAG: hypothetical protein Kow00105_15040 [Phycisphaeraceae bacterium]
MSLWTRLTWILCLLVMACPAVAQQATLVPADARFAVVLNPSKVYQSRLGQTVLDLVRQEEPNIDAIIDELNETAGLDLRHSLGQTILFGTSYDKSDFALVADIGPTSGNLNGLMLAAPGYESDVYRDSVIIHSLPDENDPTGRIYCAIPKRPGTGSFYLVASFDPDRTRRMVDLTMDANARLTPDHANGNTLIEAWFNGLPELAAAAQADGPPSAVAQLVQSGHFALSEIGDSVQAKVTLTMVDVLRSQQVFELLRGGVAMLQLAATAEPQAQPLGELASLINLEHAPNSTEITASLNSSYDKLFSLIEQLKALDQQHAHGHNHEGNGHNETAPIPTTP